MVKIAFIYDGQGSQVTGMGQDLYEAYPGIRKYFDRPLEDKTIAHFVFDAEESILNETQYTQPALIAFELAVTDVLKSKGIIPSGTAGLSIGEYAALATAEVISTDAAQTIAQVRGAAMARAVTLDDGSQMKTSMLAVMGLSEEIIRPLIDGSGVYIANLNAPGQVVIAGKIDDIEKVKDILTSKGARRIIPLKVSGPFHTPYMEAAGQALTELFDTIPFESPSIDLALNTTGKLVDENTDIRREMVTQVQSTTRFESDLRALIETGVTHFIEIGTKKTLQGFMKRIDRKIPVLPAFDMETIEAICADLEENND